MNYKVSVIIPVYNAEKYLEECIDSVINQTIGFENIQLILVNDGSKDNSKEIIDNIANKYDNIEVLHLEESHKMAGFARNEGIKLAKGKYIMFLDSDDYYDKKACELMYNIMEEQNADIVTANYKCTEQDGIPWKKEMFDKNIYKTQELEEPSEKFFYLYCPSACLKMFRAKIIKDNDIKFLNGVPAEDAYFTSLALSKSNKIYYLDEPIYYYRRRNTGEVSTSWMRNEKYFRGVNYAFNEIYKVFKKENKLEYYKYFYAKNLISLLYKFIDSKLITNEEKIQLLDEMYWFFKQSKELKITFSQKSVEILLNKILERKNEEIIEICEIIAEIRQLMSEVEKERMTKPQKMIL